MYDHIIQGSEAVRQPHLIASMGRLRHEVFKERLQWDVRSVQGIEFDEFDLPQTVYGATTDAEGRLEGCFRLLPTTGRYMLRDVFPQLLHGAPAPESDGVLETSRFAVLPSSWRHNAKSALVMITARLLDLQLSYCLEHNVHTVLAATDLRFERLLGAAGLQCHRFGPPLRVGCTHAVAGWMQPTEENLAQVRGVYQELTGRHEASAPLHVVPPVDDRPGAYNGLGE